MSGITAEDCAAGEALAIELGLESMALSVNFVRAFAQHRIAARNAALEDAAKVAEDALLWDSSDPSRVVATAIRTLSTQDTPDMRATNKGDEA